MTAILTTDLTKKYGNFTAVNNVSLDIRQGELFALLGVNGAGKTTLIRMLSCLTPPTSGEAWICGHSILSKAESVHGIINLSPQETAVAPNLSVRENLVLIAGIYGIADVNRAVEDILEKLSLRDVENQRAKTLSGGWQRRLSIAMALISHPKVLFLDEPTLGLDVLARRQLWQLIEQLKEQMTIVLTTHYLEEAEALSDRIGIMRKGSLTATGTAAELIKLANASDFENAFITLSGELS